MSPSRRALLGAGALALALPARSEPRARLALALGGGSARGFAHIGVARALEQAGIAVDLIVGTSAGALVGAFMAAGWSAAQMEAFALQVREADVADFASAGRRGMLAGEALARIVGERLRGAQIEQLRTRYAAVTTDLRSGELVLLRQGPVADAVRASCSIPGVFVPSMVQGRELVDGGLVSPLPVRAARQLGAEIVLAVDVAARPRRHELSGLYEVILQSFEIMGRALADQEALQADLVIRPDTAQFASSDFGVRREMIQAGFEAAQPLIPALRKRLETGTPRPRRG
jgi:NTE family protein